MPARSHIRWWIIGLIGVATVINYVDRTSLAVMWPAITKDTGLSKDAYASIVSIFMAYDNGRITWIQVYWVFF